MSDAVDTPRATWPVVLLGLNAAWHGAAAYYFLCRPMGILKKYFNFTPTPTHAHLVRYLGTHPQPRDTFIISIIL